MNAPKPSARALRFAVIGSPIAHSRSPDMHAAAYRALGFPHTYEKVETSEAELSDRLAALRAGVYAGLNVTVPHKQRVLALVDEVDPSAEGAGAANTLELLPGGRVRAHNTDVPALAEEILRLGGERVGPPPDASALVLGTGGAARAAVVALASIGYARIVVRGRSLADPDVARAHAAALEVLAASAAPAGSSPVVVTGGLSADDADEARVRAIVQATTCGMAGGPPGALVADAVAWEALPSTAVVLDVVYGAATPFLAAAARRGLRHADGLGMLSAQGALAFALWLGTAPPFDVMRAALEG